MQNLLSLFAPRLKHNSFREMFSSSGSGFRQIFLLLIIVSVISIVEFYLMIQKSLTIEVNRKDDVQPLILLFTHNHSRKTRDHICRGLRNENHPVNFDACPKKCQFSCRREDFHRRRFLLAVSTLRSKSNVVRSTLDLLVVGSARSSSGIHENLVDVQLVESVRFRFEWSLFLFVGR